MDILHSILVILHFIGLAGVIGGFMAVMKSPTVNKAMIHGAITQVVTGLLLVGLAEMGDDPVNHVKVAIKLLVALVVLTAVFVGAKATEPQQQALWARIAGSLAILNVVIAVVVH